MMAIINLPNQEEIIDDLNNQIFNCIEPKVLARAYWSTLEEYIYGGISEETAYMYVNKWIKEETCTNTET